MTLVPRTAFGRTFVLLLTVSVVIMAGTVALVGAYRARNWGALTAELALTRLRLIEPVIDTLGPRDAPRFVAEEYAAMGLVLSRRVPFGRAAPLARRLLARHLRAELGAGGELRVRRGRPLMLWLRTPQTHGLWLGMPLPTRNVRVLALTALWLLLIAFIALVGALLFARQHTAPLRRLALFAPALARGEVPADYRPSGTVEVRQLGEALLAAAHESKHLREERELWLAGVSHDLRTPLARLRFSAEMLPEDLDLRAGIIEDIEHLDTLIGQFLDYLRLGREEAVAEADVAALLRDALARIRGGEAVEVTGELRAPVRPQALSRAVTNLVVNGLKYGRPPVQVRVARRDGVARVAVTDHGAGLPDAEFRRLTVPFVQGDTARAAGGTGLGLAIVARVVALHSGELRALSGPDGFTVELTWPLAKAPASSYRPRSRLVPQRRQAE